MLKSFILAPIAEFSQITRDTKTTPLDQKTVVQEMAHYLQEHPNDLSQTKTPSRSLASDSQNSLQTSSTSNESPFLKDITHTVNELTDAAKLGSYNEKKLDETIETIGDYMAHLNPDEMQERTQLLYQLESLGSIAVTEPLKQTIVTQLTFMHKSNKTEATDAADSVLRYYLTIELDPEKKQAALSAILDSN